MQQWMADLMPVLTASDPKAATARFREQVLARGASYFQARAYSRPVGRLTSQRHYAAGGVIERHAVPGWEGSASFNFICFDKNPLLRPIREGRTRYRFSDFAPHRDRRFGDYWEALSEARIGEALCATSYGPAGRIASVHIGFAEGAPPPDCARAVHRAALLFTDHLVDLARPAPETPPPALTPREADCLAYVAEGKTDWEIAVILSLSEATVRFHIDNARAKLDAATRAHAVAKWASLGQL
ncbi:helix-turn-helix transcriptional regulator [Erythrobacter sp. CCH5-A1]|jgi:DNA-binding CsgD family transcriptional regulator|uniref:helix-turn-helix transcriptional regulator n=1 Tax=Erythrobacter sp. CCH5-A1 TaxID=1768792 RepID=UPI000832C757|nr:helix-turn-helix transcriptional regulator [Erythrobacter sp. CCH5-A1]